MLLAQFASYLQKAEAATITTELALAWARQPATARPFWWAHRLSTARGFARYLHALDPRHEVPPPDLLPAGPHRAEPFIYTPTETADLVRAAGQVAHPLMAATYSTYIGLLAATGMRAGEAIALDRDDLNWSEGLLVVRDAKFGKSREIVLHPTTLCALRNYDRRRNCFLSKPRTPAFFVSTVGTRLIYSNVQHIFHELTMRVGLEPRPERCRPRLHDLRHTFAVNTLLGWYRAGVDVAERMHLLTTYLGHTQPSDTYWYLSATPELLALVGQRLERQLGDLA
jgi:integrase